MNYILNIDTTSEIAIINISDGDKVIGTLFNEDVKQHASFLHHSIEQLLKGNNLKPPELRAIGVTGGPGSYTGIRIGLATAKGLCFALKIPMMMFNTLEVMAFSAIKRVAKADSFYCPIIDARRMEVFTAVYDEQLNQIMEPSAMILTEDSFKDIVQNQPVYFFGSGSEKFEKLINNPPKNYLFFEENISSDSLAKFSWKKFQNSDFENLATSKPLYIKEFFSNIKIG